VLTLRDSQQGCHTAYLVMPVVKVVTVRRNGLHDGAGLRTEGELPLAGLARFESDLCYGFLSISPIFGKLRPLKLCWFSLKWKEGALR